MTGKQKFVVNELKNMISQVKIDFRTLPNAVFSTMKMDDNRIT